MSREKKPRSSLHVQRQRLDRAAELYLQKCYRTNTTARVSEFAMDLGLTPEYLSSLATQLLGISLRDYFRDKQLRYAAWLLETLPSEMTIEEIAARSAFGTTRTFYRCFQEAYGTSPGAFRDLRK